MNKWTEQKEFLRGLLGTFAKKTGFILSLTDARQELGQTRLAANDCRSLANTLDQVPDAHL
jgi:hypothetical protein